MLGNVNGGVPWSQFCWCISKLPTWIFLSTNRHCAPFPPSPSLDNGHYKFGNFWPIVIHINYFMGVLTLFFFWRGPYWLAYHNFFGNIEHAPIEAPLWTASCKIETNVLPMAYLCRFILHESWTLGKPYGIKVRCYWERFGGTLWEPHGNT
jgi:hypothetical protein